jgi:hypothetical protein
MAYEQPRTNVIIADLEVAVLQLEKIAKTRMNSSEACARVSEFLKREISKRMSRAAGLQIEGERK